jgi:hypothetical protein
MMRLWLGVLGALLVQEPASTAAVLLISLRGGINPWLIHLAWLLLTIGKIALGYALGLMVHRGFSHSRVAHWGRVIGNHFVHRVPSGARKLAFGLLGLLTFTWSPAFVAAWIEFPFWTMGMWLLAGNLLWYILEWALVLGVGAVASSLEIALVLVLAIGIVFTLLINAVRNKTKLMR